MGNKDFRRYMNPPVEDKEICETTEVEEVKEPVIGIVSDCIKLNIRKEPNKDADVICEIAALSELLIDEVASTDDWYKVCTGAGVEGFCMKKYVVIKS